jgi:hypothetical protein
MAFAALTIDLDARLAKFEEGMKRATSTVESSAKTMESKLALVKGGIAALAGAFSVGVFVTMAKEMVTSAAALDDFSEKTGASIEKLSELQQVAKIGGQDFAAVTDLLVKMTRALSGAGSEDETKAIGAGLAAIGLQAEELRRLDPADALKRIAVALNGYNDSQNKTAIASAILGKSAADYLPYLKDLASTSGIAAKVTAEQAGQAEALEKALNRLSLESYNAKQSMLLGLVPALSNAIAQFNVAKEAAGGLAGALLLLARVSNADPGGQLNKINASLGKLRETQEALENPKGAAQGLKKFLNTEDAAIVRLQIADLEQKRELLLEVQRQQNAARGSALFGDVKGEVVKNDLPTFKIPAAGKGEGAKQSPFEGLLKQLESETTKVSELSRQFQVLDMISLGHYGKLTEAQKEQALALARDIDRIKEQAKIEKETAEAKAKFSIEGDNARKKELDALEESRKKYIELIDPLQKYREQLDEIRKLVDKGVLTPTQGIEAEFKVGEAMDAALGIGKDLNKELAKTKDITEEVFQKLSSGFEDALINGEKFNDVVKSIGKDLLKIFVREQITAPAGAFFKDIFKDIFKSDQPEQLGGPGFGGGSGAAGYGGFIGEAFNVVKGLFGFANGGEFRVGGSGGTDSQLVAFKASPNETVTVRTPAQQGAGGGQPIVMNSTYNFGSDVNRSTLASWADAIEQKTIASVANLTRRGGNYSRAVRG